MHKRIISQTFRKEHAMRDLMVYSRMKATTRKHRSSKTIAEIGFSITAKY